MRKHLLMLMILMMTTFFGLYGQGVGSEIIHEVEAESLPLTGSYENVQYDGTTNLVRVPVGGTVSLSVAAVLDGEGVLFLRGRVIEPELVDFYVNGEQVKLESTGGLGWLSLDGGSYSGLTTFAVQIVNRGGLIDVDKIALAKRGAVSLGPVMPISDVIAGTTAANGVKLYFSGEELAGSTVAAYRKMTVEGYTRYLQDTLGALSESELAVKIAEHMVKPDSRIGELILTGNSDYAIVDPTPLDGYQCHYYLVAESGLDKSLNSKKITLTYSSVGNSVATLEHTTSPGESYLYNSKEDVVTVDEGNLTTASAGAALYLNGSETILNLPTFLKSASFLKGKEEARSGAFTLERESVVYLYLPEVTAADESYYFSRGYNLVKIPVKLTAGQSTNYSYFFYKRYRAGRADSLYLESPSNERFKSEKIFKTVIEADDLVIYFNDSGTTLDSSYSVTMSAMENATPAVTGAMTEISPGLWQYRIPNGALTYKGSSLSFSFENEQMTSITKTAWSWDFTGYVAAKREAMSGVLFFSVEAEDSLDINFSSEGTADNRGLEHYLTDNGALYGVKANGKSYGFNEAHNLLSSGVLRGENIKGSYVDDPMGDSLKIELDTTGTIIDSVLSVDISYSYDGITYLTAPMNGLGANKWESSLSIDAGAGKLFFYFSRGGINYDYKGSSWEWAFYKEKGFKPVYERDLAEREYVTLAAEPNNKLLNNELKNWSISLPKGDYRYRVMVEVDQSAVTADNNRAQIKVNNRIHTIDATYQGAFELRGEEFISQGMLAISNEGRLPVKMWAVYLNRADNVINSLIHPHHFEWDNNGTYTPIYQELVNLEGTKLIRARFKLVEPAFIDQYSGVDRRLELLFNGSSAGADRLVFATDRTFSADTVVAKVALDREHNSYRVDLSDYTAQIRAAGDWLELYIKSEGATQMASHYSYVTQFQLDSTVIIDPAFAYQGEGMITKNAQGTYIFTSSDGTESFNSYSGPYNLDQYLNIPVMIKGYKDSPTWLHIFEIKPLIRVLGVTGDSYTNKLSPSWTADCTPGTTGLRYRVVKETGYKNVTGLTITEAIAREGEYILDIIPMVSYTQGESYSHRFIVDRTGPELVVTESVPAYTKAGAYPVNLSAVDKYSKNLEYYYRVDDRDTAVQGTPVKLGTASGDYSVNLPEGRVKLNLYALDELGNSSVLYSKDVTADSTVPIVVDLEKGYFSYIEAGVKTQKVAFRYVNYDNLTGEGNFSNYYKVGNEPFKMVNGNVLELDFDTFLVDGNYQITVYTVDKAGNKSLEITKNFVIDRVPIDLPVNYEVSNYNNFCNLSWTDLKPDSTFSHYEIRRSPVFNNGGANNEIFKTKDSFYKDVNDFYNPEAIYYIKVVDIYGNESAEITCYAMKKQEVVGEIGQQVTLNMAEAGHKVIVKKSANTPKAIGLIKSQITLDEKIRSEYGLISNKIFYFGPSGTVFDTPITWKVPLNDLSGNLSSKKDRLVVYNYNPIRNLWEKVETTYNRQEDCLEARLHHFSIYGVGEDIDNKVDFPKRKTNISSSDGSLSSVIDLVNLSSFKGEYELKLNFDSKRFNDISKYIVPEDDKLIASVFYDMKSAWDEESYVLDNIHELLRKDGSGALYIPPWELDKSKVKNTYAVNHCHPWLYNNFKTNYIRPTALSYILSRVVSKEDRTFFESCFGLTHTIINGSVHGTEPLFYKKSLSVDDERRFNRLLNYVFFKKNYRYVFKDYSKSPRNLGYIDYGWQLNIPKLLKDKPEYNQYKYVRFDDGSQYELSPLNNKYKNRNGRRFIYVDLSNKSDASHLIIGEDNKNYLFDDDGQIKYIFSGKVDSTVTDLDITKYQIIYKFIYADNILTVEGVSIDGTITDKIELEFEPVTDLTSEKYYIRRLKNIKKYKINEGAWQLVDTIVLSYKDYPGLSGLKDSYIYTYNSSKVEPAKTIKVKLNRLSNVDYYINDSKLVTKSRTIDYSFSEEYEYLKSSVNLPGLANSTLEAVDYYLVSKEDEAKYANQGHIIRYSYNRDAPAITRDLYFSFYGVLDNVVNRYRTLSQVSIIGNKVKEVYDFEDYTHVDSWNIFQSQIHSYVKKKSLYLLKDKDTLLNGTTPIVTHYHYKKNTNDELTPFSRMVEVRENENFTADVNGVVTTAKDNGKYFYTETINDRIYGPVDVRSGVISGSYNPLAFDAYENDVVPADGTPVSVKELSDVVAVESYSRKSSNMGRGNRLYSSSGYVKDGALAEELIQSYSEQDYTKDDNLQTKREFINSSDFKKTDYTYVADHGTDSLYLNPKVKTVTEELGNGVTLTQVNTYDDSTKSTAGVYRLTKSEAKRSDDTTRSMVSFYAYDANDRLIKEVKAVEIKNGGTVTIDSADGIVKTYVYDSLGNVVETKVSGKTNLLDGTGAIQNSSTRTMVTKNYYGNMSNRLRAVKEYELVGGSEVGKKIKLFYYDDKGRVYRTATLHYDDAGEVMTKADVESKFYNEHAGANVGNMLFATGSWVNIEKSANYTADIVNLSATGGVYAEELPVTTAATDTTPATTSVTADQTRYSGYVDEIKDLNKNKFDFSLSTTTKFIAASYSLHYGSYVLRQVEYKLEPGATGNGSATKRFLDIKVDSQGRPLTKTTDSGLIYSYEYDSLGSLKKEKFPVEADMDPVFYAKFFERYGVKSYKYYNGTQFCQPEAAQYYEMSQTDGLGRTVYSRKKSKDSENAIDIVESVKYNHGGQPVELTGANGEKQVIAYNLFGVVDKTVTAVDGTQLITEWNKYDSYGNSIREYSEIAVNSKSDTPLVEKEYDQFGQVVMETIFQDSEVVKSGTPAKNVTVEKVYNRQGQTVLEKSNIYTQAELNRTEYKYNSYGQLSEKIYHALDPSDKTTLIKYVEKTTYDEYRRVKTQVTTRKVGTAGAEENISKTVFAGYNNDGKVTTQYSISEGRNWVKTENTYNDNSQLIQTDEVVLANSILTATEVELAAAAVLRTMSSYTQYDDIYRESVVLGADDSVSKVTYNRRGQKAKEYSGLKLTAGVPTFTNGKLDIPLNLGTAKPTEYSYSYAGLLVKENIGTLYEKSTGYDGLGRKVKEVSNPNTDKELVTEYTYDKLGREVKVKSGHIMTEVISWETGPEKTKEIRTYVTDSTGNTIYKSYTESEVYSVMGNLVKSTDRDGYIYKERVNELGETVQSSKSILEGGLEKVIKEAVNSYENSIHTGGTITKVTLDAATGLEKFVEDTIIGYTYTSKGETASITTNRKKTEGVNVTGEPTVAKTFTYTTAGEIATETTTAGTDSKTVKYTYEATGELKELIYPDGTKKKPTYDQATGRLKEVVHGNKLIVSEVNYNQNMATSYKTGEGAHAVTKSHIFNDLMQMEEINYNNGAFKQNYTYDRAGNIIRIDEAAANDSLVKTVMDRDYTYDSRNRLINAKYDANGSAKKILYRLNPKVSYQENDYYPNKPAFNTTTPESVDIQKGASSIILKGRNNADIKPDFIRIKRKDLQQLVDSKQINLYYQNATGGFDTLDETLPQQYSIKSSANYFDIDIEKDFAAKAFKLNFEPNRMNSAQESQGSNLSRKLVEIGEYYSYATDMEISYTYDHFDNRESVTNRLKKGGTLLESKSNSYTYSQDKKLLLSDNTFSYHYDTEGNLVKKEETATPTNYWQYTWSADGYLIKVDKHDNSGIIFTETYVYDESGVRLLSDANDTLKGDAYTTRYVYDGSNLIYETTTKGAVTTKKSMVYALGELQAVIIPTGIGTDTQATYYHADVIGSTRFTSNANWESSDFIFDPFGNEELVGTSTYNGESNYYTFAGHVPKNEMTGLTYMKARWMDNASGRFISRDPAKDGLNWYVYCGNNPTTMIDPTGLTAYNFSNLYKNTIFNKVGYFLSSLPGAAKEFGMNVLEFGAGFGYGVAIAAKDTVVGLYTLSKMTAPIMNPLLMINNPEFFELWGATFKAIPHLPSMLYNAIDEQTSFWFSGEGMTPFEAGNRLGYAATDLFLADMAFAGLGKLGTVGKVTKSFNYVADVARFGDEVADAARYGDEIADVNKIVDGPDYSKIGKHFDDGKSKIPTREEALKQLFKELEKEGVDIFTDEGSVGYLEWATKQKGSRVNGFFHENSIGVRPDDIYNIPVIREEFIHIKQFRESEVEIGPNFYHKGNPGYDFELEARIELIKNRHKWGLTNDEVRNAIWEIRKMEERGFY